MKKSSYISGQIAKFARKDFTMIRYLLFFLLWPFYLLADDGNKPIDVKARKAYEMIRTDGAITIDGKIDDEAWQSIEFTNNFIQTFPSDTALAKSLTEVKMTYDDINIYIAAKCHDELKGDYIIQSLRRDFESNGADGFYFILDPFDDQTNGFIFGVNPSGVQKEALIVNGGNSFRDSETTSWDNKWQSAVSKDEGAWIVEMAIPFKTVRFNEGSSNWKINFARFDYKRNERSVWSPIPRNFNHTSLAFAGDLNWDKPLEKPGTRIAVIPYISGSRIKDFEAGTAAESDFGFGADIKLGVTPSLNLDLTINPDFSQVEVDQQVANLTRFEVNLPERRQFFLENSDLFGNFGSRSARPFFSRRIGITTDPETSETVENPIILGARLSGKLNDSWRVGVMSMQTKKQLENLRPSTNYTVAAVQKKVFGTSNIAAMIVSRQATGDLNGEDYDLDNLSQNNRTAALEYNLQTRNNRWAGKVYYHRSMDDKTDNDKAFSHGAELNYRTERIRATWQHGWVGENFNADVGFVTRTGYYSASPSVWFYSYPESKIFNRIGPRVQARYFWRPGEGLLDRKTEVGYAMRFQNNSFLMVNVASEWVKLTSDFDPTRTDSQELLSGTEYNFNYLSAFYWSDSSKPFSLTARTTLGNFYNGKRYSISGDLNYRMAPLGVISVDYSINRVELPAPYASTTLLLIGPKIDLTFSKNLFFSTLLQYNNQNDNFNINSRLQWRFKPVSDFFLVYTDNYMADGFVAKNRALVFKLTYWLNL